MYAYIKHADQSLEFVEIIPISITPGVPPRPHPEPPLGIWGPGDPRPTLPIAGWDPGTGNFPGGGGGQPPLGIWGPGDPRPTLPIAGWDPGTGNFPGGGGGGGGSPGPGMQAIVLPMPPTEPPATPPTGMPADSKQMLIWFGPGTKPAMAWVGPYASTGPVTPPAEGAQGAQGAAPAPAKK